MDRVARGWAGAMLEKDRGRFDLPGARGEMEGGLTVQGARICIGAGIEQTAERREVRESWSGMEGLGVRCEVLGRLEDHTPRFRWSVCALTPHT